MTGQIRESRSENSTGSKRCWGGVWLGSLLMGPVFASFTYAPHTQPGAPPRTAVVESKLTKNQKKNVRKKQQRAETPEDVSAALTSAAHFPLPALFHSLTPRGWRRSLPEHNCQPRSQIGYKGHLALTRLRS